MTTTKTAYQKPTCRGSYALGTACQKCERCAEELALLGATQRALHPVGRSAEYLMAAADDLERVVETLQAESRQNFPKTIAEARETAAFLRRAATDLGVDAEYQAEVTRLRAHISALEAQPKATASAVECAREIQQTCVARLFDGNYSFDDSDVEKAAALITAHTASAVAEARERALEEALRNQSWMGLFLDGRNEHGTHVLPLPASSFGGLTENDLYEQAEEIFKAAEGAGHSTNHAIVGCFKWISGEESHDGYWEFFGYSPELTAALYGTASQQSSDLAVQPTATEGGV